MSFEYFIGCAIILSAFMALAVDWRDSIYVNKEV